jgi:hypothetical protein
MWIFYSKYCLGNIFRSQSDSAARLESHFPPLNNWFVTWNNKILRRISKSRADWEITVLCGALVVLEIERDHQCYCSALASMELSALCHSACCRCFSVTRNVETCMENSPNRIIAAVVGFHSIQIEFLYNSMQSRYQHEYVDRLHVQQCCCCCCFLLLITNNPWLSF